MSVKPAPRRRRAYDGGARKAKQSVLDGPHFEEPPTASVPSRFPIATSLRSSCRIDEEKNPAPPSDEGTMAMSPTQVIETGGRAALEPPARTAASAAAAIASSAKTRAMGRC